MSDPQPLSRALSELIALKGLARVRGESQLAGIWQSIAGDHIARSTRVLRIHRGILEVAVGNSALLAELDGFHKASLLEELAFQAPHLNVKNMKFKLNGNLRKT